MVTADCACGTFSSDDVPEMHFLFDDIEARRRIFRGWLKTFGTVDRDDTIRLKLVMGVDRDHPHRYGMAVSYQAAGGLDSGTRFLGFYVSRRAASRSVSIADGTSPSRGGATCAPTTHASADRSHAESLGLTRHYLRDEHIRTPSPEIIALPHVR